MSCSQLVRGVNKTPLHSVCGSAIIILECVGYFILTNIFKHPTQKPETIHKKVIICWSISNEESYRLSIMGDHSLEKVNNSLYLGNNDCYVELDELVAKEEFQTIVKV
jgi:hypothetical protein